MSRMFFHRFYCLLLFTLMALSTTTRYAHSQTKLSALAGGYYNGNLLKDETQGYGVTAGIEFQRNRSLSIELRGRLGMYAYNDGVRWTQNDDGTWMPENIFQKSNLKYKLFTPMLGIVPKLKYSLDEFIDDVTVFVENEFAVGCMTGNFIYYGEPYTEKSFSAPLWSYNIGVGVEFQCGKAPMRISVGYSTMNFRNKIIENQPKGYQGYIPNQNAVIMVNAVFRIPVSNSSRSK